MPKERLHRNCWCYLISLLCVWLMVLASLGLGNDLQKALFFTLGGASIGLALYTSVSTGLLLRDRVEVSVYFFAILLSMLAAMVNESDSSRMLSTVLPPLVGFAGLIYELLLVLAGKQEWEVAGAWLLIAAPPVTAFWTAILMMLPFIP
jgi:hypothetical protein